MKPWWLFIRAVALAPVFVLLGVVPLAAQAGDPAEASIAAVRAVRYHVEPARTRVWFETSGTLFYTHYSPDPLTLVIDLPGADITAIAEHTVVGSQEVESITATRLDGTSGKSLSRIEIKLGSLVPYQISATEHALTVLFEGAGSPPETASPATPAASAATDLEPTTPVVAATDSSLGNESEAANEDIRAQRQEVTTSELPDSPSMASGSPTSEVPPVRQPSGPASVIDSISHSISEGLLTVSVGGDGWLNYTSFRLEEPSRLVFDFAGTINRVPTARVSIDAVGVYRVRVAQFQSANPRITRIVFDLESDILHRAVSEGSELKIYFSTSADRLAGLGPPPDSDDTDEMAVAGGIGSDSFGFTEPSPSVASMEPVAVVAQSLTPGQSAPDSGIAPGLPEPPPQEPPSTDAPTQPGQRVLQRATIGGEQREYTGELISLDFKDGDIQDIFRLFADISGLNIVVQPGVTGRITLVLTEVPWDQALDLILKAHRLGYVVEGNVIRIAPLTELAQEEADRRRLAEEQALAGDLSTMLRELSYAKASDVQSLVQRNLSARGDSVVDDRTNTLIITDLADRLDTIDDLIVTLDAPIPGVEIAARVVVTGRNYSRNLGIQWGFTGHADAAFGNSNELTFPNSVLLDGQSIGSNVVEEFRSAPVQNTGIQRPLVGADQAQRGYAVNLPMPGDPTGAIGLALGSITGAFNLDVVLAAAERRGLARIISAPKIITQNNKAAEIKQGLTFPVQVVANNTVTVTFKDAVLELLVTPQITSADTIILDIEVNNDTADFSRSVNGIPSIITQSATTQVLVPDGSTTVIGGVFVNEQQRNQTFVPLLHRIPVLGHLFKTDQKLETNQELLIFLTPRIRKGEV
jgi:type IV pilus assembly protein PilQ